MGIWKILPTMKLLSCLFSINSLIEGFNDGKCYKDNGADRILPHKAFDGQGNTWKAINQKSECIQVCGNVGFSLAGVQNGWQCFCGDDVPDSSLIKDDVDCQAKICPGNPDEFCGGGHRMIIYQVGS